jgi:hypothetical protein
MQKRPAGAPSRSRAATKRPPGNIDAPTALERFEFPPRELRQACASRTSRRANPAAGRECSVIDTFISGSALSCRAARPPLCARASGRCSVRNPRRALGVKLVAFRERRSHVEAVDRCLHPGADQGRRFTSARRACKLRLHVGRGGGAGMRNCLAWLGGDVTGREPIRPFRLSAPCEASEGQYGPRLAHRSTAILFRLFGVTGTTRQNGRTKLSGRYVPRVQLH